MSNHVLVEKRDVRTQDEKNFFGIAPSKIIRLKYGPAVKITSVVKAGNTFEVKAERLSEEEVAKLPPIKGVLNWISQKDALKCEFRLYERLFNVERPTLEGADLAERRKELNPNSLTVCSNAVINKNLAKDLKKDDRFQFERIGFFVVDLDTNFEKGKYVFNRILESQSKMK